MIDNKSQYFWICFPFQFGVSENDGPFLSAGGSDHELGNLKKEIEIVFLSKWIIKFIS